MSFPDRRTIVTAVLLLATATAPAAQGGSVQSHLKWSGAAGTLPVSPVASDAYSGSLENIGDLDGDGIPDVAVGVSGTSSNGIEGEVWIQFLNADGSVRATQKIGEGIGGFTGVLDAFDRFGGAIANLGDLDGDGVTDIAVGAYGDDDGGGSPGAVYILFLETDGTVQAHQKISDTQGGFTATLDDLDFFGEGLACIGDLDGDGVQDLVAAAPLDDDGGTDRGAVYVLFLNTNGTVKSYTKISSTVGLFFGQLDNSDHFGLNCLTLLGDMDGDGKPEIAVGADADDDGGTNRGALWILELFSNGLVSGFSKISSTSGGFSGKLENGDNFGSSVDCLGDFTGNGVPDLVVGAKNDDGNGTNRGALWLLFMNSDGTVHYQEEIADARGGFTGTLDDDDRIGFALTVIDDRDGNGVDEVVVGAYGDDDDAADAGAAYVLFLGPCSVAASTTSRNAGGNPQSYTATPPRLDQLWTTTVDLTTTGHSFAVVFGFDTPVQIPLSSGQTLLAFDAFGSGEFLGLPAAAGPIATTQLFIPLDPSLCGLTIATQAIHYGGVIPFALSNALDLVIGV